ncbi:hypothetical protein CPB84DRAFT_1783136 [Gymnopilus junonius]|uniref:Uncharacterized protein n=1 Tax=Gymnopilus junonius TaxID=109634 RepID=A0A9P5NLJ7_GYMJU|nr:hypothetical protein CPB84DRAFT_1783136 [Gymnopilus junonius]
MLFQRCFLLAAACLTVSALPISQPNRFTARDVNASAALYDRAVDAVYAELVRRVLDDHQLSEEVLATQKAQAQKVVADNEKHKQVDKIKKATPKVRAPDDKVAGKSPKERAALHQEANDKAKDRAVTEAQKKSKAERTQKWEDAKGKLAPVVGSGSGSRKILDPGEKAQVAGALHDAAEKMQHTVDIPGKKDEYTVGTHTSNGKDVRKAVMNSILHEDVPVGRGINKMPKEFRNEPYAPTHPTMAGQRPINNPSGAKLNEYPVTSQSQGWIGSGQVGPARVITSSTGGVDTLHGVVGHDVSKGGDKDDHYLAVHKKN